MNNKTFYKSIGLFTTFVYLLCVIVAIFSVEEYELADTTLKIGFLLLTPSIYFLFSAIGEILSKLSEISEKLEEFEVDTDAKENEEPQEEVTEEKEIDNDEQDAEEKVEENEEDNETSEEEETVSEPVIQNGKIQCRHCGKFNKLKRTYCYMCGKKLRD